MADLTIDAFCSAALSVIKMPIRLMFHEVALFFAVFGGISSNCLAKDDAPLHLETEIPLPGVEGRIDHFSTDDVGQRLFIAALENGSIEIINTRRRERMAEIKGLQEPQGVYYNAKTSRLYVATGGDGKLRIYDGKSLVEQQTLEFDDDADNVRFDQKTGDIWVGYGNGAIGIVNSAGQKVGSISLGSHPESFVFEENGDRVFVNVPKQFGVAVIDRKKSEVIAKWGLGLSFGNYPMALDDANKRLFVGCRLPARLVVLDTDSGRKITTLSAVGDSDDIFYDPAKRLVYVLGGEGAVEVLQQRDPDHYESIGRTPTAPGARTGLFLASSGRLYVAVPHRGSQAAKILVYSIDR